MTKYSAGAARQPLWRLGFGSVGLMLVLIGLPSIDPGLAQDLQFHRIATGTSGSTNYAIGGTIASAVSSPPGSRPCDRGGSCGVPGLVAVVQSTNGSVENVEAMSTGLAESALIEADVVYWAYRGTGLFRDREPADGLRAIANLFPSAVQVAVPKSSGILSIGDLEGKRISLGEAGSSTEATARAILSVYGIKMDEIEPFSYPPGRASDLLEVGEIDAVFIISGVPTTAITDLAERVPLRILPIDGTPGEELKTFYPFFTGVDIAAGTYPNVAYTPTIGINTQWIISANADEEFVYRLTESLWHEKNRLLFEKGHPEGKGIVKESALDHVAIPLHPGAKRFYQEQGIKK